MLVVIDANIVISSLIHGKILDVLFSSKMELVGPELLFTEIHRHKAEIKQKSHLSDIEFELFLYLFEKKIKIVPMDEFIFFLPAAEKLLGDHKKDAPYIALALHLKCSLWSYEKRFQKIKTIEIISMHDILEQLKG